MSREKENITASFRKARIEGEAMLQDGRITWADFQFCMLGYELQLQELGVNL